MTESVTRPEITIGIICYNAENTIDRAIRSALNQLHSNFEIVIVDDASTDGSILKIEKFLNGSQCRLIRHQTNQGQGSARNSIIEAATGKFVVFFDDDDVSRPNRLQVQKKTILTYEKRFNTNKVACYASGKRIYPNGYIVASQAIGSEGDVPPNGAKVAYYLLAFQRQKGWFYGSGTPTSGLMIRRKLLVTVGGFDPALRRVEDIDLAVRLAVFGTYFVGSKKHLVDRNMTHSNYKSSEQNLIAEQHLASKHRELLEDAGIYYHAYNWPALRYRHFKRDYLRFILTLAGLLFHNPSMTVAHLFKTGPKRLIHEQNMNS